MKDESKFVRKIFDLTEREYHEKNTCFEHSYLIKKDTWKDEGDTLGSINVLYFDGDGGVALISGDAESCENSGFRIEIIESRYCDIRWDLMSEIIKTMQSFNRSIGE